MLVPKRGVVKVARCLHATLITYIRTDRLTVQKNKTKQKKHTTNPLLSLENIA